MAPTTITRITWLRNFTVGDTFAICYECGEIGVAMRSELEALGIGDDLIGEAQDRPGEWVYVDRAAEVSLALRQAKAAAKALAEAAPDAPGQLGVRNAYTKLARDIAKLIEAADRPRFAS